MRIGFQIETREIVNRTSVAKHIWIVLSTLVSACVSPVLDWVIPADQGYLRWTVWGFLTAILVFIAVKIEYSSYREERRKERERENERRNRYSKMVLSWITRLVEKKSKSILDNSYGFKVPVRERPFYYSVHGYLADICSYLRFTVSDAIDVESDYVDVSLIYRYACEEHWQWLAGKSGLSASIDLDSFVNEHGTLYRHIVRDGISFEFCNDKLRSPYYQQGRRDKINDGVGSYYVLRISLSNNECEYVDAVLLISTYGVNFVPLDAPEPEVAKFKKIIALEILPYFIALIQSEFAYLYLRHRENERCASRGMDDLPKACPLMQARNQGRCA